MTDGEVAEGDLIPLLPSRLRVPLQFGKFWQPKNSPYGPSRSTIGVVLQAGQE